MFTNFDDSVIKIIEDAKEYTKKWFKVNKIGTESFLYVMFSNEESICRILLEDYRVTNEEIKDAISSYMLIRSNNGEYTDKFLEVIQMAKAISKENNSSIVLEEHLLFALLVVKDTIFEALIKKLNLNSLILIEDLKEYFYIKTTEEVNNYSTNLTNLAKENKLNKLIGRESYLERMQVVLGRKNKNNILLIGSAGVGKTALVEGLCYLLLKEKNDKEIISINVSSLVANTKYRGDFEARINTVLNEVINSNNKILFIDEIHTIIGAGSSDNSLDISNIIKPYLVRDNFRCIGATTTEEYQKSIYKDKALARRFQPIFVDELSEDETLNVLNKIADDYVKFHKVNIDKKYLNYIVKTCKDKITNRKFPDKAIDLMDEAMCLAKMEHVSNTKITHIEQALKNISGVGLGTIVHNFKYKELESFYLDHYLGVTTKKNLLTIKYLGNDKNLESLLEEIKLGFGISNEAILNLDLSNFTENNSLSLLLGTSPGYVGYEDGGILSEHYAKFIYQIVVVKNFILAANDIKQFILSMIKNGVFFDRKGREFKTTNSLFLFIDKEQVESQIGFINHVKKQNNEMFDLVIENAKDTSEINPYIESFKYRGFDISFDEEDFHKNETSYKKALLELLKTYNKGKYFLFYNDKTNKTEITNK